MQTVTLARQAMATRFELVLLGEDAARLRAAGEEALGEIDRLEARWSLYRPGSEIERVNALAARQPAPVSGPTFQLLQLACRLQAETDGAFDIAIAPLVRCWGFMDGAGRIPSAEELAAARALSGTRHILLDAESKTVRFAVEGAMIDLGAIGKGAAIDAAAETLRAAGVECALLHGGTSSVHAIGAPPGTDGWKIAVASPPGHPPTGKAVLLRDESLSVSAVWGKCFEDHGRKLGHVIDPRTGMPVNHASLAAVTSVSAAEGDALSTALLVLGFDGRRKFAAQRPNARSLVMASEDEGYRLEAAGFGDFH